MTVTDINDLAAFRAPTELSVSFDLTSRYAENVETCALEGTVRFNPEDGQSRIVVHFPDEGLNFDFVYPLGLRMQDQSEYLGAHSVLCRQALALPALTRLTPHTLDASHTGVQPANLLWSVTGTSYSLRRDSFGFAGIFPDALTGGSPVAWTAPGADITVFGTYYLAATGTIRVRRENYTILNPDNGWSLCQVGVLTELARVNWNDLTGLQRLVEQVLSGDAESGLVMSSLQDSAELQRGRAIYDWKQATIAAREAFAGKALKPQLVETAIHSAVASFAPLSIQDLLTVEEENLLGRADTGMITLNSLFVFGSELKSLPACFVGRMPHSTDLEIVRAFYTDLLARLNERKLGTVLVDSDKPERFWVTRFPDLLNEHRPAFGIHPTATLIPASEWLSAN